MPDPISRSKDGSAHDFKICDVLEKEWNLKLEKGCERVYVRLAVYPHVLFQDIYPASRGWSVIHYRRKFVPAFTYPVMIPLIAYTWSSHRMRAPLKAEALSILKSHDHKPLLTKITNKGADFCRCAWHIRSWKQSADIKALKPLDLEWFDVASLTPPLPFHARSVVTNYHIHLAMKSLAYGGTLDLEDKTPHAHSLYHLKLYTFHGIIIDTRRNKFVIVSPENVIRNPQKVENVRFTTAQKLKEGKYKAMLFCSTSMGLLSRGSRRDDVTSRCQIHVLGRARREELKAMIFAESARESCSSVVKGALEALKSVNASNLLNASEEFLKKVEELCKGVRLRPQKEVADYFGVEAREEYAVPPCIKPLCDYAFRLRRASFVERVGLLRELKTQMRDLGRIIEYYLKRREAVAS